MLGGQQRPPKCIQGTAHGKERQGDIVQGLVSLGRTWSSF